MKRVVRKLASLWILLISFVFTHSVKASSASDISSRINTVRKNLQDKKSQSTDQMILTGREFSQEKEINDWINWGNWGNWNNWNNWKNWNNWSNWGNWGKTRNHYRKRQ